MKGVVFKLILAGILLGSLGSVSAMVAAIIVYYTASAADLSLPVSFLKYSAVFAATIGTVCMMAWYVYILYLVKFYIKFFIENMWKDKK